MKNKIVVSIGGRDYTLVAMENEEYVRRCAELVDQQLQEVLRDSRLSQADAAVLAAMNVADLYLKAGDRGKSAPPGEGEPGGGQQPEAGAVRGQAGDI